VEIEGKKGGGREEGNKRGGHKELKPRRDSHSEPRRLFM
jgi:hypothetical protein